MKIAYYIADLLYEYECVVIPGLGGFISRDFPASIHPVKHYFSPPHREIAFNPWLRANDGLLLNHIALNEKLPYHEAKSRLDRFVLKCLSALAEGKRIHFRNVGSLHYNKDHQIVFEPDSHQNYLPDAFGLAGFVSPPIKREAPSVREPVFNKPARKQEEPPPTPPANLKTTSKTRKPMIASYRPSPLRRQLLIVGTVAAAMLSGIAIMNRNVVSAYYQQYAAHASFLPIFYASPGEYLIKHLDKLPKDMLLIQQENHQQSIDDKRIRISNDDLHPAQPYRPEGSKEDGLFKQHSPEQNDADHTKTVEMGYVKGFSLANKNQAEKTSSMSIETAEVKQSRVTANEHEIDVALPETRLKSGFYIVAGAFRERANAEKLVMQLKARNFDASICGQTPGGLWRVAYERLDGREEANLRLKQIKQIADSKAWLLVI